MRETVRRRALLPELTKRVKELILANNLDYAGVASAELLVNEPEKHKPTDYLPGALSVVSFGIKLGLGAQLSNELAHEGGPRHTIFSYLWHGYNLPSWQFLDRTALKVTRLLEREGYIAVPVMSASTFDVQGNLMEFSNLRAAVAAGLGDLGWSGEVLTPEHGPRVRFGSVITTADLVPDRMYSGPRLCNIESCSKLGGGRTLCAARCPTHALGPDSSEVKIGNSTFTVARLDRFKCMWASMGLIKETSGLRDIPMPANVGVEDIFAALDQRDPAQALELGCLSLRGDYCGRCILSCPVGASEKVARRVRMARKKKAASST
jgi:epoxyqueuosine reductase